MMESVSNSKTFRTVLFVLVVLCHAFALLIPGCTLFNKSEKKENAFRVKLGEVELNSGPVVGPPERLPDEPGLPPPPQPEEPETPVVPKEPDTPVIPPREPVIPPKEPTVPAKKPVVKPKPKPRKKPKVKPKTKPKAKPKTKNKQTRRTKPVKRKTGTKPKDDGVYRPDNQSTQIGKGYRGQNNARIPIGSRNAAQTYGKKFDNRAPGGGASESMERYGKNLVRYLKSRWTYPPKSLLGGKTPAVLIELDIAADGRVTASRIVNRSGIKAMDESIERMLEQLERVPSPPDKKVKLEIIMQMKE
ncbi:MAG: TonB C-terminal domain-containing protein [Lentisphaeria bacterium]|nr:TonB C-terminal domain-containing protein [Lentisphaeria bacterium]